MTTHLNVGVIGIGAMGMAVAQRLLSVGYAVHVRDIRNEREHEAAASGAMVHPSPAALAAECDAIITLVVDDKQTESILFGADGALHGLRKDSVVLLSSTVAPNYVARANERLAARGIALIDAPVSGGPLRARQGEMSMMLAAPNAVLARCNALLDALSNKHFIISEHAGDAAKMKLVNNLLAAANLAAGCEAIALGAKLGLDIQSMFKVINASSGASWVFADRMVRALADDYLPRAATTLLTKDSALALEQARSVDFDAPIGRAAHAAFVRAVERGYADEDDAALLKSSLRSE